MHYSVFSEKSLIHKNQVPNDLFHESEQCTSLDEVVINSALKNPSYYPKKCIRNYTFSEGILLLFLQY